MRRTVWSVSACTRFWICCWTAASCFSRLGSRGPLGASADWAQAEEAARARSAAIDACLILISDHIPYADTTPYSPKRLSRYRRRKGDIDGERGISNLRLRSPFLLTDP